MPRRELSDKPRRQVVPQHILVFSKSSERESICRQGPTQGSGVETRPPSAASPSRTAVSPGLEQRRGYLSGARNHSRVLFVRRTGGKKLEGASMV